MEQRTVSAVRRVILCTVLFLISWTVWMGWHS
jgi:hypothetical protein